VEGTVTGVEVGARRVTLAEGGSEAYDLVSFDVGSRAAGEETPGVREHALTVKPLSKAVAVRHRLDELAATESDAPRRVIVVGAGSAGVEVACAAAARLDAAGVPREVLLLEAGPRILATYDDRFRRLARRALAERGVAVETGQQVAAVKPAGVRLADGGERGADLVIWLTGPAAPLLFRDSGLPLDGRGFLWVDAALRAPGHPNVFAAGDCATPRSRPDTPKAGVYAVRQAPVLWRSLTATLGGQDPLAEGIHYEPQEGFLSLLNTADGRALLSWKGMAVRARWAWWLKDWIDRRFVRRYQRGD
jgi:selenide,water dikinase